MTQKEINEYKKAIFAMYCNINLFMNTDTAEEINAQLSFYNGSYYMNGSKVSIDNKAIVLKKLKDLNQQDLHVISTISKTNFNNLGELSQFLKHHMLFKESIMFYNIFIQLGVAIPYLNLSVADLESNKIIVCNEYPKNNP